MDTTYTDIELAVFADAVSLGIREHFTVDQRLNLGYYESRALAKEVLDFLAGDYPTVEAAEEALDSSSLQLQKLVEFGVIELTAS